MSSDPSPAPVTPRTLDFDAMAGEAYAEHREPHDECRAPILHRVIALAIEREAAAPATEVLRAVLWQLMASVERHLETNHGHHHTEQAGPSMGQSIRLLRRAVEVAKEAMDLPPKRKGSAALASPEPTPDTGLTAEALAVADHEWSMANLRVRCTAHFVPVRPCTPDDHREWAEAILARLSEPTP